MQNILSGICFLRHYAYGGAIHILIDYTLLCAFSRVMLKCVPLYIIINPKGSVNASWR
jgi:hypothetical protein